MTTLSQYGTHEGGWSDGLRSGVGQLDRHVWSAWLHARGLVGLVGAWLVEHEVRLDGDGSAPPPSERVIGPLATRRRGSEPRVGRRSGPGAQDRLSTTRADRR